MPKGKILKYPFGYFHTFSFNDLVGDYMEKRGITLMA